MFPMLLIYGESYALQSSFGVIPNVRAKGKASVRVADILNHMQAEEPLNPSDVIVITFRTLLTNDPTWHIIYL